MSGGRVLVGRGSAGGDDLLGSFRWYDTLCINQDNMEERSSQVQIMDSIYSKAARTLVWLGTMRSLAHATRALELLCQLVNDWDKR
jgi:hypothetical protein